MISKHNKGVKKIKNESHIEDSVVLLKPKCLTGQYQKPECQFYKIILYNQNTGVIVGNPLDGGCQTQLQRNSIMGIASNKLIKKYFPKLCKPNRKSPRQ